MSYGYYGPESELALVKEANANPPAVGYLEGLLAEADVEWEIARYGTVRRQVIRERMALIEYLLVDFRRLRELAEEIVLVSEAYEEGNIDTAVYDDEMGHLRAERRSIRRRQGLLAETRA